MYALKYHCNDSVITLLTDKSKYQLIKQLNLIATVLLYDDETEEVQMYVTHFQLLKRDGTKERYFVVKL